MMDLVTVVFRDELDLLKTQAQSIHLYARDINRIRVVINDDDDYVIDPAWWGRYHDRVDMRHYTYYGIPKMSSGWDQQQISKIMGAKESTEWALVLDAKTWFVRGFSLDTFIGPDGKIDIRTQKIQPVFEHGWRFLLEHFGLPYIDQIVGPGGVPYLMDRRVVNTIGHYAKPNLVGFFCENVMEPNFITEFNLYSAMVLMIHKDYSPYSQTQRFRPVNITHGEEHDFERLFEEMKREDTLTVSIHREARKLITADQFDRWKYWLATKGLNT